VSPGTRVESQTWMNRELISTPLGCLGQRVCYHAQLRASWVLRDTPRPCFETPFATQLYHSLFNPMCCAGGHAYTLGRVPIGSCDFDPESFSFAAVVNDTALEHFDRNVTHDQAALLPLIRATQHTATAGGRTLRVVRGERR
jgi:hypothetical protein